MFKNCSGTSQTALAHQCVMYFYILPFAIKFAKNFAVYACVLYQATALRMFLNKAQAWAINALSRGAA
jgi:hypothetical protein